jgi:hypothetical protein
MIKDPNHLTPFRRQVLASIRRGQTPLDPKLAVPDRRQVLWAVDALFEMGMIDIGFRIKPAGQQALEWKPRKKSEGNPGLNERRRDKCFMCKSRTCHLRIHVPGDVYDELACFEHRNELRKNAEVTLNVAQRADMRIVESAERLRRERLSGS